MTCSKLDQALASLNDAQRRAVTSPITNAMQVLAGPGSGKTKVLTVRVAYLMERLHISPWNMVVMTFTKAAATEMKERISQLLEKPEQIQNLNIGTFHSVCIRLLARHKEKTDFRGLSFSILDDSDQKEILREVVKDDRYLEAVKRAGYRQDGKSTFVKDSVSYPLATDPIRKYISKIKVGEAVLPSAGADDPYSLAFKFYEKERLELQSLDFDDILLYGERLLISHPEVIRNTRVVLVDEYQDVSKIQIRIANLFAQQSQALNVIGDPDQSIYGFRYADPKVSQEILNTQYTELKNEFLEKSYRSTQEILDLSLGVIKLDTGRIAPQRKLIGQEGFDGHVPHIVEFATEKDQAENIASAIERLVKTSGGVIKFHDVAILLRTNASFREYELKLNLLKIPYRTVGATQFWQKAEVSRTLDYLRLIYNPYDTIRLKRILSTGKYGIGESKLRSIVEWSRNRGMDSLTFLDACLEDDQLRKDVGLTKKSIMKFMSVINSAKGCIDQDLSISGVVTAIKSIDSNAGILRNLANEDKAGAEKQESNEETLRKKLARKAQTRQENFNELVRYIENFQAEPEEEVEFSQTDILGKILGHIALSNDNQPNGTDQSMESIRDKVTISTMHSSKGLEWPVVFVANCHDRVMYGTEDSVNEERRVLFVALTRAKALLNVTYSTKITTFARKQEQTTLSRLVSDNSLKKFRIFSKRRIPELTKEDFYRLAKFLKRKEPEFEKNTLFFSYDNVQKQTSQGYTGFVKASELNPLKDLKSESGDQCKILKVKSENRNVSISRRNSTSNSNTTSKMSKENIKPARSDPFTSFIVAEHPNNVKKREKPSAFAKFIKARDVADPPTANSIPKRRKVE